MARKGRRSAYDKRRSQKSPAHARDSNRGGNDRRGTDRATAPYNFVPLPKKVFEVKDKLAIGGVQPWEAHDRFLPGTYSGWIELEIDALTPLFIRGPVTKKNGKWDSRSARVRWEFYTWPDGRPAIPGSSLRGMVRTLVEILSFAKIQPVTDEQLFYRDVGDYNLGNYFSQQIKDHGRVKAGFVRRIGNQWFIQPTSYVCVSYEILEKCSAQASPIEKDRNSNWVPPKEWQHRECWVLLDRTGKRARCIKFEKPDNDAGWKPAILLLTGVVPNKTTQAVFLKNEEQLGTTSRGDWIRIPEELWERFHSDEQLSDWQERAYRADLPGRGKGAKPGRLSDGDPVYYLADNNLANDENPTGLIFFGRAQRFRLPCELSPWDLVPEEHRNAGVDLAEAIFGMVDPSGKRRPIRTRVYFEDAVAEETTHQREKLYHYRVVPHALSAPKITAYQNYLESDSGTHTWQLKTCLKDEQFKADRIRGHKLYWHRWDANTWNLKSATEKREGEGDTPTLGALLNHLKGKPDRTVIQPIREGTRFRGRIRFENLTNLELGALLAALNLPEGCHHRLGMGKPLGFGSVKISSVLYLIDRRRRYEGWVGSGAENASAKVQEFMSAFGDAILEHARSSDEPMKANATTLSDIDRLRTLYRLLSWRNRPKPSQTSYMALTAFKKRLVLPSADEVWETSQAGPDRRSRQAGGSVPRVQTRKSTGR